MKRNSCQSPTKTKSFSKSLELFIWHVLWVNLCLQSFFSSFFSISWVLFFMLEVKEGVVQRSRDVSTLPKKSIEWRVHSSYKFLICLVSFVLKSHLHPPWFSLGILWISHEIFYCSNDASFVDRRVSFTQSRHFQFFVMIEEFFSNRKYFSLFNFHIIPRKNTENFRIYSF